MHNRVLWTIYAVTFALGVGTAIWIAGDATAGHLQSAVPILAALLVSIGWMVTALLTNLNNQRGRTIDTITTSKDGNAACWDIINEYVPSKTQLPLPDEPPLNFPDDHALYKTVDKLLNDFDFIALGATKGVYDTDMLYSALVNDFLDLQDTTRNYISQVQTQRNDPEIWIEFCKLCDKWRAEPARLASGDIVATIVILLAAAVADAIAIFLRWR